MQDLLELYFSDEDLKIEEIKADDQQQSEQFTVGLLERLRKFQLSEGNVEAEISVCEKNKLKYITAEIIDPEVEDFTLEMSQMKEYHVTEFRKLKFAIPLPSEKDAPAWAKKLQAYSTHLSRILNELSDELGMVVDRAIVSPSEQELKLMSQTKPKFKELIKLYVICAILEYMVRERLKVLVEKCTATQTQEDFGANGMWIVGGKKVTKTSKVILPLKAKLRLDSRQTRNLVNICFSKRKDIIAQAKLDLYARMDEDLKLTISKEPEKSLAIAFAEAGLKSEEVLSFVMHRADERSHHMCIQCNSTIDISKSDVYHRECKVVQWLTTYYAYKYMQSEQTLSLVQRAYIDHETKVRISGMLELYYQLTRDVVRTDSTGTYAYERSQHGVLRKRDLRSIPLDQQVGSHQWRAKLGYSPKRK